MTAMVGCFNGMMIYLWAHRQRFPKFIIWQLIVLENKRLKQWGIIKGELCALPLDREDAGPLQPASMKGKEFPIGRWGIPGAPPQ
ncbi:MAG: hypothetical protein A3F10_01955 [Coxiella sp. RIFCSPHIGHO2_12_FULL_42_15]|nr:MAG: hypothetical protein A3F10_01955 [Coxiella sp. RIFCSPHIGHO2_12_FULL_42_15]